MNAETVKYIRQLGEEYNKEEYFATDPIIFPKHFFKLMRGEDPNLGKEEELRLPVPQDYNVQLQDVEIAAVVAAHLAWGRRAMIVRDTKRALDEMEWKPLEYIMRGVYRDEDASLHRTVKWSEFAAICRRLKAFYSSHASLEELSPDMMRVEIYGQKSNPKMANKKIHMLRRWMVRDDGIVDLGIWKNTSAAELIIPLDVHVHNSALTLGITQRQGADYQTAKEITDFLKEVFPQDPCKGDFALFAHSIATAEKKTRQAQPVKGK